MKVEKFYDSFEIIINTYLLEKVESEKMIKMQQNFHYLNSYIRKKRKKFNWDGKWSKKGI